MYFVCYVRVGEGTVPMAIVVYIDGSFMKHKIPVKPIYVTVWQYLQPQHGGVRQSLRLEGAGHDIQPEKKCNPCSDGFMAEGLQAQATSCMYSSCCRDGDQVL